MVAIAATHANKLSLRFAIVCTNVLTGRTGSTGIFRDPPPEKCRRSTQACKLIGVEIRPNPDPVWHDLNLPFV